MSDAWKWVQTALILVIMVSALTVHASADRHVGQELPPHMAVSQGGETDVQAEAGETVMAIERRETVGFRVLTSFLFGGNETRTNVNSMVPAAQTEQASPVSGSFSS